MDLSFFTNIDFLYFAALFIPSISALFIIRWTFLRRDINGLQSLTDNYTDTTYEEFESIIYTPRRKDRDPGRAIDVAARFLSWKDIQQDLMKFYRFNRYYEAIDIVGVGLIILAKCLYDLLPSPDLFLFKIVILAVTTSLCIVSLATFLVSYAKIDRAEQRLGIGQPRSTH
jgi:hypothetical protein